MDGLCLNVPQDFSEGTTISTVAWNEARFRVL